MYAPGNKPLLSAGLITLGQQQRDTAAEQDLLVLFLPCAFLPGRAM